MLMEMEFFMGKKWQKVIFQILDNLQQADSIKCPNCGKCGIDYTYVGDETDRTGYLLIWCNKCLKGTYVSRAKAPENAKFINFDDKSKSAVPEYEFVEE